MSKEAMGQGSVCACGNTFAYPEYHWPHCPFNPVNMSAKTNGAGNALLKKLQARFSKSELESISTHGPVADKPVGSRGTRGKKGHRS